MERFATLSNQGAWTDGICIHNSETGRTRVVPWQRSSLSIDRNPVTLTLLEALKKLGPLFGHHSHALILWFDTMVESVIDSSSREHDCDGMLHYGL